MDGNGRWAQRQGLARTEGHGAGEVALVDVTYGALAIGVKALTVYAFSTENWRRPIDEVRYLMNFNQSLLERRQHELHDEGVRITFSGRRDWRVPRRVTKNMDEAAELTKNNKTMTLNIAFNYGGRAEIVDAVQQLVRDNVAANKVDEKAIRSRLYHPELPDPDLVIRTSCSGRWPTPSWSSPRCCGPTFDAKTSTRPSRSFSVASDASGGSTREVHPRDDRARDTALRLLVGARPQRRVEPGGPADHSGGVGGARGGWGRVEPFHGHHPSTPALPGPR